MRPRPRPDDVRSRPSPRIFYKAQVEAKNYEVEAEAEACCLLLLQDVY